MCELVSTRIVGGVWCQGWRYYVGSYTTHSLINSFNAKCIYTYILTHPYNHLCDACQCCVYFKESL